MIARGCSSKPGLLNMPRAVSPANRTGQQEASRWELLRRLSDASNADVEAAEVQKEMRVAFSKIMNHNYD